MTLSPDGRLQVFTIFSRPSDMPDANYVVRAFAITAAGPEAGPIVGTADTLDGARALIPPGSDARFAASPDDEPHVVESWM